LTKGVPNRLRPFIFSRTYINRKHQNRQNKRMEQDGIRWNGMGRNGIKKGNGGAHAWPFLHLTVLNKKKKLVKV
jgi:hypothetical protein